MVLGFAAEKTQSPWRAEGKERFAPRTQFLLVFCPRPSTELTGASLGSLLSDYWLPDLGGAERGLLPISYQCAWLLTYLGNRILFRCVRSDSKPS